jgi:hypothetical protein
MVASMGYKRLDAEQGNRAGKGWRFDAAEIVERGRRREFFRTAALTLTLYLAQWPLRLTALGRLKSAAPLDPVIPARLSLLIDVGFLLALLFVALRAWGWARSRRLEAKWLRLSHNGVRLVCLGAALHFIGLVRLWYLVDVKETENITFWLTFRQVALLEGSGWHGIAWYSVIAAAISIVGLGLTVYPLKFRGKAKELLGVPEPDRKDDVVICCSGGGIRASAFSLGGLQVLREEGIYDRAAAVVGVSGGGYIAAAHHIVRWNIHDDKSGTGDWELAPTDMPAYSSGSPETRWLRRHTKYLLDSVASFTHAALSLAFGIAVNLLLVAVAIGGAAWLLGWLFLASGRLQPWRDDQPLNGIGGVWPTHWAWETSMWTAASFVWVVPLVGVGLFVAEKAIDRFLALSVSRRSWLRIPSRWLIWLGATLTVLVLVVPSAVESLNQYIATSGSPSAWLLHQFGLVPDAICDKILASGHASCGIEAGKTVSPQSTLTTASVSLAAVVSAILAVLASAMGAATSKDSGNGVLANLIGKVWLKVKDPVVPYVAVTVILFVGVAFFLREVSWLVTEQRQDSWLVVKPAKVEHWINALILTALLVAAKVLTDANRTSMHHFFRERIADAFFVRRTETAVDPIDYHVPLRFSKAAPPADKGPRLVACAVANVTDQELVPSKRGCTPFVFGHNRMGLTDRLLPEGAARRASSLYEFASDEFYRDATIPAAVAISAAAFSPLAGRENVRLGPYRAVLALGNARLGVWLPNPIWVDEWELLKRMLQLGQLAEAASIWAGLSEQEKGQLGLPQEKVQKLNEAVSQGAENVDYNPPLLKWHRRMAKVRTIFKKPGMFSLIREAFGQASVFDRFLYVTDGGHYDNLGLIEALRRRPKEIYVLDASNDPEDTFRALGRAIATARMDLDCELVMDPRGMRRLAQTRSGSAWCVGKYTYTTGGEIQGEGTVYLAKAILLEGLPWDIETYAFENREFPRTSTGNQLYSEFDFEAYRQLGSNAVRALLKSKEERAARERRLASLGSAVGAAEFARGNGGQQTT